MSNEQNGMSNEQTSLADKKWGRNPEQDPEFFIEYWKHMVLAPRSERIFFMPMFHECIKVQKEHPNWEETQDSALAYREYWRDELFNGADYSDDCMGERAFTC